MHWLFACYDRLTCVSFPASAAKTGSITRSRMIALIIHKPINIIRMFGGDHLPAYKRPPATNASMARLKAIISIHSTAASVSRKKYTTAMPGQTMRNNINTAGRITVPGNTKVTRPALIAMSIISKGHNHANHDVRNTIFLPLLLPQASPEHWHCRELPHLPGLYLYIWTSVLLNISVNLPDLCRSLANRSRRPG